MLLVFLVSNLDQFYAASLSIIGLPAFFSFSSLHILIWIRHVSQIWPQLSATRPQQLASAQGHKNSSNNKV